MIRLLEYLIKRLLATHLQRESNQKYTIIEKEFLFDTLKVLDDLVYCINKHKSKWKEVIEDIAI